MPRLGNLKSSGLFTNTAFFSSTFTFLPYLYLRLVDVSRSPRALAPRMHRIAPWSVVRTICTSFTCDSVRSMPYSDECSNQERVKERYADSSGAISFNIG